jgi:hypothetical protein
MIRKEDFPDAGTKSKAWIVGQSQLFDVVCNSLKQLQTIWHHMTVRYPRTLDHRTTRYYTHLQTIMSCSAECFMFLRNTWKMAIDLLLVCFVQLKTAGTGVVTCRNQLLACPLRLHLKQTKRQRSMQRMGQVGILSCRMPSFRSTRSDRHELVPHWWSLRCAIRSSAIDIFFVCKINKWLTV